MGAVPAEKITKRSKSDKVGIDSTQGRGSCIDDPNSPLWEGNLRASRSLNDMMANESPGRERSLRASRSINDMIAGERPFEAFDTLRWTMAPGKV